MLSSDDAFGLTEEKKKEWCLMSVSDAGHPTYQCMGCHACRITVSVKGDALPKACTSCGKPLARPAVTNRMAIALMTSAGHRNLIGDAKHAEAPRADNARYR